MTQNGRQKVYLRQDIQVEPLFNRWFAWVLLVPPTTAALYLKERYLTVMESYVNSPMLHVAAVKDPKMRGGPFIDLGGKYIDEMKSLIVETKESNAEILAFASAIQSLSTLLAEKAKGYPMQPLYEEVPDQLRGLVELCYDLSNQPSFRFFEPLVYRSSFFQEKAQSVALSVIQRDHERPFIMSTPRFDDDQTVHLRLPFSSPGLDTLFAMKTRAEPYETALKHLGCEVGDEALFRSFFTEEAPQPYERYDGDAFRIRYFGHACILVETKEVTILLDPILSYTYESNVSRYTYQDLPDEIDYVLITHSHHDHILMETMLQIRHKVKEIIVGRNYDGLLQDPSLELLLRSAGFDRVREIRDLEEIPIPGGFIMGIPFMGEHHDLSINSRSCFYIRIGDRSVLSVSDSCTVEPRLYERVYQEVGEVDTLFLGMECDGAPISWVYGSLLPKPLPREIDYSRRARGCNCGEGMAIVDQFKFKEVYVYAMGQEPWLRHILANELTEESNPIQQSRQLIEACQSRGITAEYLFGEKEILVD